MSDNVAGIPAANVALAAVIVAALGIGGIVAHRVEPQVEVTAGLSASDQEKVDQAASASLFGQFRSSMADFLWLKVDKYFHNGVDLRGLTPQERIAASSSVDQVQSADAGKDGARAHHGDETTVVPSQAKDWRGFYGDLEREVKPYKDMSHHTHADPKEALPLFRLMTASNPHFIPGYTVGAAMIARDHTRIDMALAFLAEGEKNNPESVEIESEIGELTSFRKRNYTAAQPHLIRAIQMAAARDMGTLTEDESDAYQAAFRWLALDRRELGDRPGARAAALAGLKVFPKDIVCRDVLKTVK